MTIEYKKSPTASIDTSFCGWAVCYDIDGKNYDDRKPRTCATAIFTYPYDAERYIINFLPAETRNRFYIVHI